MVTPGQPCNGIICLVKQGSTWSRLVNLAMEFLRVKEIVLFFTRQRVLPGKNVKRSTVLRQGWTWTSHGVNKRWACDVMGRPVAVGERRAPHSNCPLLVFVLLLLRRHLLRPPVHRVLSKGGPENHHARRPSARGEAKKQLVPARGIVAQWVKRGT